MENEDEANVEVAYRELRGVFGGRRAATNANEADENWLPLPFGTGKEDKK